MKCRGYTHCSAGRCRIATLQLSAKWSFVQSIYWFRYLRNNVDLDKREHQYFNHIKQKSYIWTQIVVLIQTLRHFQGLVILQIYMYHWYLNSIKPERNTQNGSSYFVIPLPHSIMGHFANIIRFENDQKHNVMIARVDVGAWIVLWRSSDTYLIHESCIVVR